MKLCLKKPSVSDYPINLLRYDYTSYLNDYEVHHRQVPVLLIGLGLVLGMLMIPHLVSAIGGAAIGGLIAALYWLEDEVQPPL